MSKELLLKMHRSDRNYLIDNHNFYYEQANKRLLSQFSDIDKEAEDYRSEYFNKLSNGFNPETDDPGHLYEISSDAAGEHYVLLSDMQSSTGLSVVTGMFHDWEKRLRDWLTKEIQRWDASKQNEIKVAVWKANFSMIMELLEDLGWSPKNERYYETLNLCRLVVNVYKHGEGGAFEDLKIHKRRDEVFDMTLMEHFSDFGPERFIDYEILKISPDKIKEFSDSIVEFWNSVPENTLNSETFILPKWLKKAFT